MCDYITILSITIYISLGKQTHDHWLGTCRQARYGITAMIENQMAGPGDYLPTEWLADDSLAGHGFWV
jgi:hypothetical protein